MQKQKFIWFV